MTLIELVVALSILATLFGVSAVAFSRSHAPSERELLLRDVAALRSAALRSRAPQRGEVRVSQRMLGVLAMPDGRVIGDRLLGIDPLTGRADAQPPR